MRFNSLKATLKTALLGAAVLLTGAGVAGAQQQINLTAAPTTANMPDGAQVPMWGYSCGAVATGSTATCTALNPNAAGTWSPVVITVPVGATGGLTISLTNNLSFANSNKVPTSIVIVGQVGEWFNPHMFTTPIFGTLGTVGRGILRGPGLINWDFGLAKDTKLGFLGEAGNLQFRADIFNIANHAQFTKVDGNISDGDVADGVRCLAAVG